MTSVLVDSTGIVIDNVAQTVGINAALGGVTVTTTNVFQVNAGAQSGITTTSGNVVFTAAGNFVANSNSGGAGGIAIGDNAVAQAVNLATGAAAKTINVGNSTGTTAITLTTGTGNLTLSANGTTTDAITIAATQAGAGINIDAGTGGARFDSTGQIVVSSTGALGSAVLLTSPNGSLSLSSGGFGMDFTTTGTAFFRHSLFSTLVITQPVEVTLADADATLTMGQLLAKILSGAPTTNRTLTTPTAADCVAGLGGSAVTDGIPFSIINTGSTNWILSANTGVTLNGNGTINNGTSGAFKLAFRNVTATTEAVTIYRMA